MTSPTIRILVPLSIAALAALATMTGCTGPSRDIRSPTPAADPPRATPRAAQPAKIPLLINGDPVGWDTLIPLLAESAGRDVVEELTLESALRRELRARGLTIGDEAVRAERSRWTRMLGPDLVADAEMSIRRRRGLGPDRFGRLLWRNAALRALIDPSEVEVSNEEVRLAMEIRQGPRYATSGVVVPDARAAIVVAERARTDARGPLAGLWSASLDQGVQPWHALLSPHDPGTPASLRQALTSTPIGSPSGVIAMDDGFGVLLVHATIVGEPADEQSVRDEVQLRKTRLAMERLAARLISQTTSHSLDRSLSWDR